MFGAAVGAGEWGMEIRPAESEGSIAVGALASRSETIRFPASVPSEEQDGHLTGPGNRPLSGSTSNLYFVPHEQRILTSIMAAAGIVGLGRD